MTCGTLSPSPSCPGCAQLLVRLSGCPERRTPGGPLAPVPRAGPALGPAPTGTVCRKAFLIRRPGVPAAETSLVTTCHRREVMFGPFVFY